MYIYKTVLEDGNVGFIGTTKNKVDFEAQLIKGVKELYYLELDLPKGDVYCLVGHFISLYNSTQNKNRKGWGLSKLIPSEYIEGLQWIEYKDSRLDEDDKMVSYYLLAFTNEEDGLYNVWCYKNSLKTLENQFVEYGERLNKGLNKIYYKEFKSLKDAIKFRTEMYYNDYVFNELEFDLLGEHEKTNHASSWERITYNRLNRDILCKIFTYDELLEELGVEKTIADNFIDYSMICRIETDLDVDITSSLNGDNIRYYKIGVKK